MRIILAFLFVCVAFFANAYDFMVEGICYNKNSDGINVEVTYEGNPHPDIWSYANAPRDIVIPEKVKYNDTTYTVTSIGIHAFFGCRNVCSVRIPNTVTSIGREAFCNCICLSKIDIPESVISIGVRAFHNTDWYNSLPDGLIYAGMVAYAYKVDRDPMPLNKSIKLKKGCTGIAGGAFSGNPEIISVRIPNTVKTIGDGALRGCGLTSITIPNSVTTIGDDCFSYSKLISIEIPNSVTTIGEFAFEGCSDLKSVTIPNSVTSIGRGAFEECKSLSSIEIPNSVTSIEELAFYDCSSLTSVVIGNSVTSIGEYAFCECVNLSSVEIPNSVTTIGHGAFQECKGLISLTIPPSLVIKDHAFASCSKLTTIIVSYYGTSKGDNSLINTELTSHPIEKPSLSIYAFSFNNCRELKVLKVPKGQRDYFKNIHVVPDEAIEEY